MKRLAALGLVALGVSTSCGLLSLGWWWLARPVGPVSYVAISVGALWAWSAGRTVIGRVMRRRGKP